MKMIFIIFLLGLIIGTYNSTTFALTEADCRECHGGIDGTVTDKHHALYYDGAYECLYCHVNYTLITDCIVCHSSASHEAAHDQIFFTTDPADDEICLSCHVNVAVSVVTEHIVRDLDCTTCHNSTDPAIQDAIDRGKGGEGQPVYCIDCHYQAEEPYDIHVSAHNEVCAVCHKLPPDQEGNILGIHSRTTRDSVWCTDCHRYGDSDLERNTIFSISVNAHEGEPPDYYYDPLPYLNGPCLNCHKKNKTNMGGKNRKGCLPCHFSAPENSWPNYLNDYYGSETWGHNFQKRNNKTKTISQW
jgi:hypothetical protein